MTIMFNWTTEAVTELRTLWTQGLSSGQIAKELNTKFNGGVTRNAVLGKGARIGGLEKRKGITHDAGGQPFNKKQKPAPKKLKSTPPRPWNDTPAAPMSRLVTLRRLNERTHCRWPLGHPDTPEFRYCGANKLKGFSYCQFHCAAAYETPGQRRMRIAAQQPKFKAGPLVLNMLANSGVANNHIEET